MGTSEVVGSSSPIKGCKPPCWEAPNAVLEHKAAAATVRASNAAGLRRSAGAPSAFTAPLFTRRSGTSSPFCDFLWASTVTDAGSFLA